MKKLLIFCFFLFLVSLFPNSVLAADQEVTMAEQGFSPNQININQGDTITFKNIDPNNAHWPASNIHPTHAIYPEFDPKQGIPPEMGWSFKFDKAGSWRFHDHLFPDHTGQITVKADPNSPTKKSDTQPLTNLIDSYKDQAMILYYKIFPNKLADRFNKLNLFQLNDSDAKELGFLMKNYGSQKILDKLLQDSGNGRLFDCHQQAHIIGRAAYKTFKAQAFQTTTLDCNSGYIHGAMEEFLNEKGTDNLKAEITDLCNSFGTNFSKFGCLHGVGHGIMAYLDYDLPSALDTCQNLGDEFAQQSCYGGAFMENIVASQGQGGLYQHQTKWVSFDPFFPCDAVGSEFGYQCYLMQTSRMLVLERYDFQKVASLCNQVQDPLRQTCFQSFGRDIAGFTLRDPQKANQLCSLSPTNFYDKCIQGVAEDIVDFWGTRLDQQAANFCGAVNGDTKKFCFQIIGSRIPGVFPKDNQKAQVICQNPNSDLKNTCLTAAQATI